MKLDILTKDDLELFRKQLLADIEELISKSAQTNEKPWLRSSEVKELLGISSGTLMNLRVKGLLKATKIEGLYLYRLDDIKKMLDEGAEE